MVKFGSVTTKFNLLGEGARLAKDISDDTKLCALLVGDKIEHLAKECFEHGADVVYLIEDPLLKNFSTDGYTKVISDALNEYKPEIVLIRCYTYRT